VGLFGRRDEKADPWQDGVSAPATIERVHATGRSEVPYGLHIGDDRDAIVLQVFMVFRFADQHGSERVVERELWVKQIRPPGASTVVAYLPGDIEGTLDYDRSQVRWPNPAEPPRGWGAGHFELEPLGLQCTASDPALAAERERFRAGPRAEATVVRHKLHALGDGLGSLHYTLQLRVGGADHEVDVHTHPAWAPNPGARLQVALDGDGAPVALDTDERFYGPPGRLLVHSTPDPSQATSLLPEGSAARPPGSGVTTELDQQLAQMKALRFQMGKRYEKNVEKILGVYLRTGQIDQATYEELLRETLS
jgi:hypothetical protein